MRKIQAVISMCLMQQHDSAVCKTTFCEPAVTTSDSNQNTQDSQRTRDFLALHSQYARWIYGYVLSLVRNHADAEDLFSETTATLWEKFDQFESGTNFRAWACRVAQLKVHEWRKKQIRTPTPVDSAFIEAVSEAHLAISAKLDSRADYLDECVSELAEEDRDLIARRYSPNASVKAIAEALGRSVHQIYRRLDSVHELLGRCIRRKNGEDSME
jgi:RNA polymerase sigma-70 factor (ECF subfamily)